MLAKSSHCRQHLRKQLLHRLDELVDERIVLRAAHAVLAQAKIERVFEQSLVVGADVERDRQGQLRRHAGAGRVERQLADRDAHAADAQVAEPEDPLAIGHHDEAHVGLRPVGEQFAQPPLCR